MDEAIEVLEGQSGCTDLYALNGILSTDQDSCGDDAAMAPKVRKPYTITKQREKWSEEEHKKFLEAVQLHGRAWRRIEEHIGTKTAVQIRSHAQKFVSKMARDANDNGTSNIQPIEIPPPRPKKKPTHPYPRKQVVRPAKEIPVLGKLERPSSPTLSVSEQDRSPTSELSVVRTESIDPFLSKNSPGSNNHRSGIPSPKNLIEGDGKHLSLGLTLARLTTEDGHTTEDEPTTELDMNSSIEHLHSKEASSAEPGTLKLFGRTIMVADSCSKSSSITAADDRSSQNPISESNCNAAMEFDSGRQSAELMNTTWPVSFLPAFYCWPPLHENEANSAGEARVIRLPWLPLYAGMPFPCVVSNDLYQSNLQNDCSGTGSNTDHEGANAVESKPDDGRDEKEAGFSVVRTATKIDGGRAVKCNKGFVPYRRCDLEEKVKRPNMAGELVGDGQTVKLCS